MKQQPLFPDDHPCHEHNSVPIGKVRLDHPDTAYEAAEEIGPKMTALRQRVYDTIRHFGGLTDVEMQELLGMNPSTQRPRRVELVEMGLVADSGQRRKTPSGRKAIVWTTTTNSPPDSKSAST